MAACRKSRSQVENIPLADSFLLPVDLVGLLVSTDLVGIFGLPLGNLSSQFFFLLNFLALPPFS
jgi:hypothetical protein